VKDKLFGLPLGKLQEEVSKTPQIVKVDVFSLYHFGFFTCGRGEIFSS
jgi:hypothetical protein